MIIDYSVIRPPADALAAFGVTAAGRYIGWDDQPGYPSMGKNITKGEAAELHDAGIAVFLAFEYAADAAAQGAPQGSLDGSLAARQLAALGAPPGMGVYFALDFDIPDYAPHLPDTPANARVKLGPAARYFDAIHAGKPSYQVGGYGGYYAIKRLFDAKLITLGWQTIAWSGGQRDPRAQLYQTGSVTLAGGADVDVHESAAADFGQWPRPEAPPPDWAYGPPRNLTVRPGRHNFHAAWTAPAGAPVKPAAYMLWVYQGAVCNQDTLVDTYPRSERGTETLPDPGGLQPGTDYTLHVAAMGPSGTHMKPGVYAAAQFTTAPQPV